MLLSSLKNLPYVSRFETGRYYLCSIENQNGHGEETNTLESLTAYCNAERLDNQGTRRKVGF